jgi:Leucine-rich repeat (LRR) protein
MECRPAQDKLELPDELPALRGSLRELSVSWLGWGPAPGAVLAPLTNLRRLDLVAMGGAEQPLDWLTSFPHLTHLNLSQSWVAPLPEDLGQVLPSLEVLLVAVCGLSSIPPGLTRLTRLDVSDNPELQVEGVAAVAEATSLRELDLSECHLRHLEGLSTLERLEVLVVRGAFYEPSYSDAEELGYLPEPDFYGPYAEEMGLDADEPPTLPHLVNLRHLDLSRSYWRVSTMLTMGGLQRLTRLDLAYALKHEDGYGNAGNLPALGALPDLTELNLERVLIDSSEWPAVGAWLGQQSQLTRLCVSSNKEMIAPPGNPEHLQQYAEGFAQLPTQLVELDLRSSNLQVWPPRLSQMTDLKVLLLGDGNQWLPGELPSWLPALQQLEVLEVEQVGPLGIKQAADLLLQLPRLREFEATQSGKLMWRMEMLLPKLERLPRMDLSPPSPLRSAPAHLLYELLGQVSRLSDRYCHPRGLFS